MWNVFQNAEFYDTRRRTVSSTCSANAVHYSADFEVGHVCQSKIASDLPYFWASQHFRYYSQLLSVCGSHGPRPMLRTKEHRGRFCGEFGGSEHGRCCDCRFGKSQSAVPVNLRVGLLLVRSGSHWLASDTPLVRSRRRLQLDCK